MGAHGSFAGVVNCMDGRVQEPVNQFLRQHFGVDYVDVVTEPGPVGLLAGGQNNERLAAVHARLDISVGKHHAVGLAVAGHHDCAGNPVPKEQQYAEIQKSAEVLSAWYPQLPVLGLWIDENWQVSVVCGAC